VLIIGLLQTNEGELRHFFAVYGVVKDCKIIVDRGGISKRFESIMKYIACKCSVFLAFWCSGTSELFIAVHKLIIQSDLYWQTLG